MICRSIGAASALIIATSFLYGCGDTDGNAERTGADTSTTGSASPAAVTESSDSVSAAWGEFWNGFRDAVRRRDSAALVGMMSPGFSYGTVPVATPEVVFRELAYNGGENWRVLDRTLDRGTRPYDLPASDRPGRVAIDSLPCGTAPCRYQSWALFEQDTGGRWRWLALIFPGD